MLSQRYEKEIGDTIRTITDMTWWLDYGETITNVLPVSVILGTAGWSTARPASVAPADPTPLTVQSTTVVDSNTNVQMFLLSGTPGNVYTVQFVVWGSTGRKITMETTIQVKQGPVAYVPPNNPDPAGSQPAYIPIAGNVTMTGPFYLFEDPLAPTEATTKHYTDALVASEVTRAEAVEATLTTTLATTNTSLTAEIARAKAAETVLTNGLTAAAIAYSQNVGRNKVHNPLFNVRQRGNGPFTTAVYMADRWVGVHSGDTVSFTHPSLTDTDRTGIGDEEAVTGMQNVFTGDAGAGSSNCVAQRIENARRLSGRTVTVSFYAKAAASGLSVGVSLDQFFGTGGSPSAVVNGSGVAIHINTNWGHYNVTLDLPSTAGKTFGTQQDSYTALNFWYSSGATAAGRAGIGVQSGTVTIWGVQLETGSTVTVLEKPDPRLDLDNCLGFFQSLTAFMASYAGGALVQTGYFLTFVKRMRGVPTITFPVTTLTNLSGFTASQISALGFIPNAQSVADGQVVFNSTVTASADL